jgi:hypothetical protein
VLEVKRDRESEKTMDDAPICVKCVEARFPPENGEPKKAPVHLPPFFLVVNLIIFRCASSIFYYFCLM